MGFKVILMLLNGTVFSIGANVLRLYEAVAELKTDHTNTH